MLCQNIALLATITQSCCGFVALSTLTLSIYFNETILIVAACIAVTTKTTKNEKISSNWNSTEFILNWQTEKLARISFFRLNHPRITPYSNSSIQFFSRIFFILAKLAFRIISEWTFFRCLIHIFQFNFIRQFEKREKKLMIRRWMVHC